MIVTRFAPSPTGRLHLGHAYSAALGHSQARSSGGRFLLRIEDLDHGRSRPEFVDGIYEDLQWLGLDWDGPVPVQSRRTQAYQQALDRLRGRGLVYACFCTRSDIAQSLTAPHGDAATSYPGTCRALPDDPERRAATPHCWRLDSVRAVEEAGVPSWRETCACFDADPSQIGDAILARKDAPASYHLSCVVDDAASGVTTVIRGADLRPSTPIQRLLQQLLDLPERTFTTVSSRMTTDGAWRSATSRRLSRPCARLAWRVANSSLTCCPASFRLVSHLATGRAAP
jgi:glutamyl-Q tRNA(Asp) synthetase